MAFLNGLAFGVLLAVLIGPVFFALLQTSLQRGVKAGTFMAVGVVLSDAFYIVICYIGFSQLFDSQRFKYFFGLGGGVLMLIFGVAALFRKIKKQAKTQEITGRRGVWRLIAKGFFLNFINPFAVALWLSAIGTVSSFDYTPSQTLWFFTGILSMIFATDFFKVYIANRLAKLLTDNVLIWMNRVAGLGLIAFGIRMLYYTLGNIL
jgi:threonine/homoserine/homoserine lactone efflux protein